MRLASVAAGGLLLDPAGCWLAPAPPVSDTWAIARGLLVFPWLEEGLFRGGLQPWLAGQRLLRARRLLGLSAANGIASLLFAAAHAPNRPLVWAAATLLPSLLVGDVRERYRAVAPCVALHAAFNAGGLVLAAWRANG